MVLFIETINFNHIFAKTVYDAFYDSEKNKLDFYGRRFKYKTEWDGWPEGLDMENFEIDYIGSDRLVFLSGGDWQEMVPVSLCLKKDTNKLIWCPFDGYTRKSATEIKLGCKDLINYIQRSMEEDCQIAGAMMGDLPQNVGNILSLGYGRITPSNKKDDEIIDLFAEKWNYYNRLQKENLMSLEESNVLNEMAIEPISEDKDNLPFYISIKTPETNKLYHAHIMKKGVKGVELGTFVITPKPPNDFNDLVEYKVGKHEGLKNIQEADRKLIVHWAKSNNNMFPGTNWEALIYNYTLALKSL